MEDADVYRVACRNVYHMICDTRLHSGPREGHHDPASQLIAIRQYLKTVFGIPEGQDLLP